MRLVEAESEVVGRVEEGEWPGRTLCSLKCASSSSGGPRSSIWAAILGEGLQ